MESLIDTILSEKDGFALGTADSSPETYCWMNQVFCTNSSRFRQRLPFGTGKGAEALLLKDEFKSVPELQITFRRLISFNPTTSPLIQAQRAHFLYLFPSSLHSLKFSCPLTLTNPMYTQKALFPFFHSPPSSPASRQPLFFSLSLTVTDHKSPRISQAFSLWHKNIITST